LHDGAALESLRLLQLAAPGMARTLPEFEVKAMDYPAEFPEPIPPIRGPFDPSKQASAII
jgi:hypothetical protein